MRNPKVTVLMPVCNGGCFLHSAIESILHQKYDPLEFLIINDGSADNSLEVIDSYASNDRRIRVVDRENRGLVASLNEGIDLATGKYIARMDADDICYPNRLTEQVSYMERNEDVILCASDFDYIDVNNRVFSYPTPPFSENREIQIAHLFVPAFVHPSVIFRTDGIRANLIYYDQHYVHAEDYDLFRRISKDFKSFYLRKKLLAWRIGNEGISVVHKVKQLQTHFKIVEEQLAQTGVEIDSGFLQQFASGRIVPNKQMLRELSEVIEKIYFLRYRYEGTEEAMFLFSFGHFFRLVYRAVVDKTGPRNTFMLFNIPKEMKMMLTKRDKLQLCLSHTMNDNLAKHITDRVYRLIQLSKSTPLSHRREQCVG